MSPILAYFMIILALLSVFGILYLHDLFKKTMGYTRVLILEKDGTHTLKWIKAKSKKSFKLDDRERSLDPRGRFIGPLGNLFVFVTDNPKPITPENVRSEIDTEDISAMVRLGYFGGKLAGIKQLSRIEVLMYINIATMLVVIVLLAMYWQDRTKAFNMLREALVRLKAISP